MSPLPSSQEPNTLYGVLILCLFWYSIELYSLKYKSLRLLCGCKVCILIQKSGMFCFLFNIRCYRIMPQLRGRALSVVQRPKEYVVILLPEEKML